MAKLNSAEEQILDDIAEWKAAEPGFISKASELLSKPLAWAGDKLIPDEVSDKFSVVTEAIVARLHDLSTWTVSEESILKATREFQVESETIIDLKKAAIQDLDNVAQNFIKKNLGLATAEGFGAGLIGWASMIADTPALFTIAFRCVYQISCCYGYGISDLEDESDERDFEIGFMLRIFRIALAASGKTKTNALIELRDFELAHREEISKNIGNDYVAKQISKAAAINISRVLVNEIVKAIFTRGAITKIPGVGAVLNAGFNYAFINDVGETASMLYRERFLLDKKGRNKIINIDIDW